MLNKTRKRMIKRLKLKFLSKNKLKFGKEFYERNVSSFFENKKKTSNLIFRNGLYTIYNSFLFYASIII